MQNNPPAQPLLEIYLLGRFQAKLDDVLTNEKRWRSRSAKSLVKPLVLEPFHALHREQIMDLLWTEQPLQTAVNNLSKANFKSTCADAYFILILPDCRK